MHIDLRWSLESAIVPVHGISVQCQFCLVDGNCIDPAGFSRCFCFLLCAFLNILAEFVLSSKGNCSQTLAPDCFLVAAGWEPSPRALQLYGSLA